MAEVTKVKLSDLGGDRQRGRYQSFINAALVMEQDEAILVDVTGIKTVYQNVSTILNRNAAYVTLGVRMAQGKTYIVKRTCPPSA